MLTATATPKRAVMSMEDAGEEEREGVSCRSIPPQASIISCLPLAAWNRHCPRDGAGAEPHARLSDHGQGPGRLQAPRGLKGAIVCPRL